MFNAFMSTALQLKDLSVLWRKALKKLLFDGSILGSGQWTQLRVIPDTRFALAV